ncbi:glutathione S-transferase [Basidiobolus meristosporus CBS 931.73]|uniref:glutathione transferase n=1 Tax=Basidiobolus meristosporus CBS 931.73 TaxID=1314790 RepID=A0A1Y1YKS9_9FUNG|nr:glutathione S-transferase [Basidiobolus meristosporus CBS 931.73]|eukprot:ORX98631.1 glutathione S-transferase [Basidiobolus meristosporus CBS 931.73]
MSTEYRILYFPIRGVAEVIRLFLEEKGQPYVSETVEYSDTSSKGWAAVKPTIHPLQQVPVFWDGDFKLLQSNAILRYLARKHDAYGRDNREAARADLIADATNDWRHRFVALSFNIDFETLKVAYIKDTIPFYLGAFEHFLEENGNTGYFAGSELSFADVCVFDITDNNLLLSPNALTKEKYPKLHKFYHDFKSRPRIADYLESDRRPKYIFVDFAQFQGYQRD